MDNITTTKITLYFVAVDTKARKGLLVSVAQAFRIKTNNKHREQPAQCVSSNGTCNYTNIRYVFTSITYPVVVTRVYIRREATCDFRDFRDDI